MRARQSGYRKRKSSQFGIRLTVMEEAMDDPAAAPDDDADETAPASVADWLPAPASAEEATEGMDTETPMVAQSWRERENRRVSTKSRMLCYPEAGRAGWKGRTCWPSAVPAAAFVASQVEPKHWATVLMKASELHRHDASAGLQPADWAELPMHWATLWAGERLQCQHEGAVAGAGCYMSIPHQGGKFWRTCRLAAETAVARAARRMTADRMLARRAGWSECTRSCSGACALSNVSIAVHSQQ